MSSEKELVLTDTQKELLHRLNRRQQKFVCNLVEGMNQTEAYMNAGYQPSSEKNAQVMSSKLLSIPMVSEAYKELCKPVAENRAKRAIGTREEAIEQLWNCFRAQNHTSFTIVETEVMTEFGPKLEQRYLMDDLKNIPEHVKRGFKDIVITNKGARPYFHNQLAVFDVISRVEGWEKASEKDEMVVDSFSDVYAIVKRCSKGRPLNEE